MHGHGRSPKQSTVQYSLVEDSISVISSLSDKASPFPEKAMTASLQSRVFTSFLNMITVKSAYRYSTGLRNRHISGFEGDSEKALNLIETLENKYSNHYYHYGAINEARVRSHLLMLTDSGCGDRKSGPQKSGSVKLKLKKTLTSAINSQLNNSPGGVAPGEKRCRLNQGR